MDAQSISNLLQQTVNQFLVRPAGSAGVGVSGFLFDVMDREEMTLESDITDSYIENNSPIQDHIALKPERFTLRAYTGELSDFTQPVLSQAIAAIRLVSNVQSLLPTFTLQANQIYDALDLVENNVGQVLSQAQDLYQLFEQGSTSSEKQQNAFNFFYSMWASRTLCTIETPWQIFQSMAIERVVPVQGADTRIISEFTVTFKKIRTAQTIVSSAAALVNTAVSALAGFSSNSAQIINPGSNQYGTWGPPSTSLGAASNPTRYDSMAIQQTNLGNFQGVDILDGPRLIIAPQVGATL